MASDQLFKEARFRGKTEKKIEEVKSIQGENARNSSSDSKDENVRI